jgi:endonuclease/exonuclease/phosphatase (EEP) superfamily protein YafD
MIVGDFNATWGNRGFRELLSDGFTDAAAARGHPFQMPWPRDRRLIPPLIRIDHVLMRGALSPLDARVGTGRGSDHRPLIVTVGVL